MKNSKQKSRTPLAAFETGQIWKLKDTNVIIGQIGKTLVHYKHCKPATPRVPVSLTSKGALEKFLIENKAVLVKS